VSLELGGSGAGSAAEGSAAVTSEAELLLEHSVIAPLAQSDRLGSTADVRRDRFGSSDELLNFSCTQQEANDEGKQAETASSGIQRSVGNSFGDDGLQNELGAQLDPGVSVDASACPVSDPEQILNFGEQVFVEHRSFDFVEQLLAGQSQDNFESLEKPEIENAELVEPECREQNGTEIAHDAEFSERVGGEFHFGNGPYTTF